MKKILIYGLVFLLLLSSVFAVTNDAVMAITFNDADIFNTDDQTDVSGFGNNAVAVGSPTTGVAGIVGEAYDFDGSSDYMTVANDASLNLVGSEKHIVGWVYSDVSLVSGQWQVFTHQDSSKQDFTMQVFNGELWFSSRAGGNSQQAITSGGWRFVEGYVDGSGNVVSCVDLTCASATTEGTDSQPLVSLEIGARKGGTLKWNGKFSYLLLYDRKLTTGERQELYNSGAGFDPYAVVIQPFFSVTANDGYNSSTIYNLTITLENGTTYTNASSNIVYTDINDSEVVNLTISADNYFNTTYTNYNTSVALVAILNQSYVKFTASEVMTGNALTGSFTFNNTRKDQNEIFTAKAGSFDVAFNKTGYLDTNFSFSLSALDNTTINVSGIGTTQLDVYAQINEINTTITNYTIDLNNDVHSYTAQVNATTGIATFFVLDNLTYNLTFTSPDYATLMANVTITAGTTAQNYTFDAFQTNSISIFVRDEVTNALLNNVTFTLDFIGSLESFSINTSNGTAFQGLITPDSYEIRYFSSSNDDYKLRSYFFTLVNASFNTITLYALNENDGAITTADITFLILDTNLQPIEDGKVVVERYFLGENGFTTVYSRFTNVDGEAFGTFESIDAFYRYSVFFNDVLEYQSSDQGVQFTSDGIITIYINPTPSASDVLQGLSNIPHTLSFTPLSNSTGFFELSFTNPNIFNICLVVTNASNTIGDICKSDTSGTIQINVTHHNLSRNVFLAEMRVLDNSLGYYYITDSLTKTYFLKDILLNEDIEATATFIVILILIGISLVLYQYPVIALVAQTAIFIALVLLPIQLVQVSTLTLGFVVSVVLGVMFIVKNK